MTNLVALFRFCLRMFILPILFFSSTVFAVISVPVSVLVFVLDGLSGYVARFGSMFDLVVDKITKARLS